MLKNITNNIIHSYYMRVFLKIRYILCKISNENIYFDLLLILECKKPNLYKPKTSNFKIKQVDLNYLEKIAACNNKRNIYENRFLLGETCIVATKDELVIGYIWFSDKNKHLEERFGYCVSFPDHSIYAYDAYISSNYRGYGVWRQILTEGWQLVDLNNKKSIIVNIAYGNSRSLDVHEKFGFIYVGKNLFIKFFNFKLFNFKPFR